MAGQSGCADGDSGKLVTAIRFTPGTSDEVRLGLIGYVSCVVGGTILLDGITLRMTAERRPALSFPTRTDKRGRRHALVRPLDDHARREIEATVFEALGIDPEGDCNVG